MIVKKFGKKIDFFQIFKNRIFSVETSLKSKMADPRWRHPSTSGRLFLLTYTEPVTLKYKILIRIFLQCTLTVWWLKYTYVIFKTCTSMARRRYCILLGRIKLWSNGCQRRPKKYKPVRADSFSCFSSRMPCCTTSATRPRDHDRHGTTATCREPGIARRNDTTQLISWEYLDAGIAYIPCCSRSNAFETATRAHIAIWRTGQNQKTGQTKIDERTDGLQHNLDQM